MLRLTLPVRTRSPDLMLDSRSDALGQVTLLLVFPLSVSNAEVRDAGAIEALETWMAEKKYPDHNLELHDFGDDYGFGLRATAPIKKGAVMLRVPEAALMYPASALRSPLAMPLKTRRIDAESVMALHFLYEYNSKKSAWKPWMALQPTAPVLLAMLKDHELGPLDGAPSQGKPHTAVAAQPVANPSQACVHTPRASKVTAQPYQACAKALAPVDV